MPLPCLPPGRYDVFLPEANQRLRHGMVPLDHVAVAAQQLQGVVAGAAGTGIRGADRPPMPFQNAAAAT